MHPYGLHRIGGAEAHDKQRQTDAVAEKSNNQRAADRTWAAAQSAPRIPASVRFTTPATRPFAQAIMRASWVAILRVRLLSSAQQAQAQATSSAPKDHRAALAGSQERTIPPSTMAAMPMTSAPIKVLAKYEPGQQRRQHPFKIQQ